MDTRIKIKKINGRWWVLVPECAKKTLSISSLDWGRYDLARSDAYWVANELTAYLQNNP